MSDCLNIQDLQYQWPQNGHHLRLNHLQIQQGQRWSLAGASGTGKSTLLNLIAGVLPISQGQIHLQDFPLHQLSNSQCDRVRADWLGIIFQQFNLLSYLTVIDNVLLPLRFSQRRSKALQDTPQQEAKRLLDALELPDSIRGQSINRLSVGQQQRVAAARALIGYPSIILADEPTSALDPTNRDRFIELLMQECEHENCALLLVSHDPALAQAMDHRCELLPTLIGSEVVLC